MKKIDDNNSPPSRAVGCILVVDEDGKGRRELCEFLEAQGYSVMIADDGEQALEKAFSNPPDVILLDVMMPKVNGFEVCRHLRQDPLLKEVAIIMMTSADDRAVRLRGMDAGADGFIARPVDMIELQGRLRNVIQLDHYRKLLHEREGTRRAQMEIMSGCEATLAACIRSLEQDGRDVPVRHERIMHLALLLAQSAGIPEPDLAPLRWSILLHAIVAMIMPAALRGRDNLAPEEEEQVLKREAWLIEKLGPVSALREALEIMACRHEYWNGSGRPNGLKGEAIPRAARVLALALAWEAVPSREASPLAERMALIKGQAGLRFEPGLVNALEHIVNNRQESREQQEESMTGVAAKSNESLPGAAPKDRFSLSSTGAKAQFAVAMALTSVIPLLVVSYMCLTGWLGFRATLDQLWPMVVMILPFMALGYWMLAKYPVNIVRLRHYMESLTRGVIPDHVALMTDEDDLAAIEVLMRKVVKQTEARVNTIESQTETLLDAERQRVMIEALGTACHHLGQPVTVISGYLEMTRRMVLPAEAQTMLAECRVAADALANILDRLQQMTVYRTEPYLAKDESAPDVSNSDQLIKI